jgi:hypothetical protein
MLSGPLDRLLAIRPRGMAVRITKAVSQWKDRVTVPKLVFVFRMGIMQAPAVLEASLAALAAHTISSLRTSAVQMIAPARLPG